MQKLIQMREPEHYHEALHGPLALREPRTNYYIYLQEQEIVKACNALHIASMAWLKMANSTLRSSMTFVE